MRAHTDEQIDNSHWWVSTSGVNLWVWSCWYSESQIWSQFLWTCSRMFGKVVFTVYYSVWNSFICRSLQSTLSKNLHTMPMCIYIHGTFYIFCQNLFFKCTKYTLNATLFPTELPQAPVTWCKVESFITKPDYISVVKTLTPPPLIVMTISLRTILNQKTHQNEVSPFNNHFAKKSLHENTSFLHFVQFWDQMWCHFW